MIRLMFYLHTNKKIMLSRLKMKRNLFTNYFIISLKQNCRSFDIILKIHFKRIKFVIRFPLQKRSFFLCQKKIMNYVFMSIIAI